MLKFAGILLLTLVITGCDTVKTVAYNRVGLKTPEVLVDMNKGSFKECKNTIGELLLPTVNDRNIHTTILLEDNKNQKVDIMLRSNLGKSRITCDGSQFKIVFIEK